MGRPPGWFYNSKWTSKFFVKVGLTKNWRLVAADPGWLVCPHPEAVEETPPPTWADPRVMAATKLLKAMVEAVWTMEISLARVAELYEGWLTMREVEWATPPDVRWFVPTTETVLAFVRPMVPGGEGFLIIEGFSMWFSFAIKITCYKNYQLAIKSDKNLQNSKFALKTIKLL